MIKLKYSDFMSFGFANTFTKLSSTTFHSNVAYRIKRIGEECNKVKESIRAEYQALLSEYAIKDEKGEFKHPDPSDPNSFDVPPEKMDEFKAKEREFGTKELTIHRLPFQATDLAGLTLSAGEVASLGGLIVFKDDEEEAAVAPVTQMKAPG